MLTAEAVVETEHPSRYLVRLCQHANKISQHPRHQPRAHDGDAPPEVRHIEWSDTIATISLSWGQWTMHATQDTLTLHVEAADEDNLRRIQELVAGRLETLGRRVHLHVVWQPPQSLSTPETRGDGST